MVRVVVNPVTLDYAECVHKKTTPTRRYSGFADTTERGTGDLLDLVGSLVIFEYLSERGVACSVNITAGKGDREDVALFVNGKPLSLNVKTSRYGPLRPGLHLYVKEEEIGKAIAGYLQVFVHLTSDPHVHLAGFLLRDTPLWNDTPVEEIPKTQGHLGKGFVCEDLYDVEYLVRLGDKRL